MLAASLSIGFCNVLKVPLIALPFRDTLNDALGLTSGSRRLGFPALALEMFVILFVVLVCALGLQKLALGFQILGSPFYFRLTQRAVPLSLFKRVQLYLFLHSTLYRL
jgi:hypothetical protein